MTSGAVWIITVAFPTLSSDDTLKAINQTLISSRDILPKVNRIIITMGTSYAFRYKQTGQIVANCHKIPGIEFERVKLSDSDIFKNLSEVFNKLKNINP